MQENGAIGLVVLQSAEILGLILCFAIHQGYVTRGKVYELSFAVYFLYTGCSREWLNRLGRTPICKDIRVNPMFRNKSFMGEY